MSLYSLAINYELFMAAVENGDIPEEAIADTLEAMTGDIDEKIDNVASAIKNMLAEAEMIKAEEKALAERRKAKERRAEKVSEYLSNMMQMLDRKKYESARHKISFRTSKPVRLTDEAAFIEWAKVNAPEAVTVTYKPSLSAIKELVGTTNVPFAVIETRQNIQIK